MQVASAPGYPADPYLDCPADLCLDYLVVELTAAVPAVAVAVSLLSPVLDVTPTYQTPLERPVLPRYAPSFALLKRSRAALAVAPVAAPPPAGEPQYFARCALPALPPTRKVLPNYLPP